MDPGGAMAVFWFWIFVGPALVLACLALRGERRRAEYVTAQLAALDEPPRHPQPPVTIIAPSPGFPEAMRSLAAQDYPDFEIVATVSAARPRSEVFVFAAADAPVSRRWLRALIEPLSDEGAGLSTSFRWYTPDPPTFWSLLRSVWNAAPAGRLGPGANDYAWDGAMAIRKTVWLETRELDALALSRAVRKSGRRIAFAPGAMVALPERATAGEFLRQARDEMREARRYLPGLWSLGLAAHVFYCGAMLAAAIASARGSRGAEWALVVQFGLGMLKGANRATLAKAELPGLKTWFDRYTWTQTFWVPLASWVWLFVLIASAFGSPPRKVPFHT